MSRLLRITIELSDAGATVLDMERERNPGVRCSDLVGLKQHKQLRADSYHQKAKSDQCPRKRSKSAAWNAQNPHSEQEKEPNSSSIPIRVVGQDQNQNHNSEYRACVNPRHSIRLGSYGTENITHVTWSNDQAQAQPPERGVER